MNRKILDIIGIILIIYLFFIYVIIPLFQSDSPIIGYDKVKWGASVEDVRKHYPNIYENKYSFLYDYGTSFTQDQNDINGKVSRTFCFFHNKLCKVIVSYESVEKELGEILYNKIVSIYGKFDKYKDDDDRPATHAREYFKNYSKNLTIELSLITRRISGINRFTISDGPLKGVWINNKGNKDYFDLIFVEYYNPIVLKQIEDAELKQENDRIQL